MDAARLAGLLPGTQIVDVRWPNEWDAGHVEGAVHIPPDELDDRLDELDRDRPVVAVCRTGSRSTLAAESLRADGFDADSLDGGLLAWAEAGLPLVASDGSAGRIVDPEAPADDRPEAHQRLQTELLQVLFAVQEHFGDQEPTEEEVRAFLRQRLIDQGRSPDEADRFLAEMDSPPG